MPDIAYYCIILHICPKTNTRTLIRFLNQSVLMSKQVVMALLVSKYLIMCTSPARKKKKKDLEKCSIGYSNFDLFSRAVSASCSTPTNMYHNRSVSDGVFWYDHGVALLFPLRRLVLHVGDGNRKFH